MTPPAKRPRGGGARLRVARVGDHTRLVTPGLNVEVTAGGIRLTMEESQGVTNRIVLTVMDMSTLLEWLDGAAWGEPD